MTLREDAQIIMDKALSASLPDAAVEKALKNKKFGSGRIVVVSIGKAAWQMAKTTVALLGDRISNTSTPKGRCRPLKSTKQGTLSSMPIPLPRQPVPLIWSRILARMIPFFFLSAVVALPFLKSLLFRFRNCRKSIPIFYRAAPISFP